MEPIKLMNTSMQEIMSAPPRRSVMLSSGIHLNEEGKLVFLEYCLNDYVCWDNAIKGNSYDLVTTDEFTFPAIAIIPPKNRPWYTKHRKSKW